MINFITHGDTPEIHDNMAEYCVIISDYMPYCRTCVMLSFLYLICKAEIMNNADI